MDIPAELRAPTPGRSGIDWVEQELPLALARGQLRIVYQPRVALDTRRVVGAEALARWPHRRHGMVPPSLFIAVAEHEVGSGRLTLDDEERMLVRLLAEGLVLDAVARRLHVSERTVRRRIRTLCERAGVDTVMQVVVCAVRQGLV